MFGLLSCASIEFLIKRRTMAARAFFEKSFNIRVTHNEVEGKFFVPTLDGEIVLRYVEEGEKTWNFTSTDVPLQARVHQLLPRIIEYALETARKSNHLIKASCPTVQNYLARNPFYESIMA